MNIQILVASHKPYWMPEDSLYLPVQAGAAGKTTADPKWQRDDEGKNISEKNASYSELTALYWGWKNLNADAIGLCHYRRYFAGKPFGNKFDRIADQKTIESALQKSNVVLPKKRHYWIETTYSQYAHAHHERDLIITREVLTEQYPKMIPAWETSMRQTSGHRFNMFVMKKPVLELYCDFLFNVLLAVEQRLDVSSYEGQSARTFGLIGERLLDVYLLTNHIQYTELPTVHLESQHWPMKIKTFLGRKLRGGKNVPCPTR